MNNTNILIRHNQIEIPSPMGETRLGTRYLATVMTNLSYYGYALNVEAYNALASLSEDEVSSWWTKVEPEFKSITGESKKMGDFVVYKNFPAEVLSKTDAEYWHAQILMYWGFSKEYFTEEVKPRDKMNDVKRPKVLQLATKSSLSNILNGYLAAPARWKDSEWNDVKQLLNSALPTISLIVFKENLVTLAKHLIDLNVYLDMKTGTDVLRLMAGLSDGDVSLRTKTKFKSFSKQTRRYILNMLEKCNNLKEDFARDPEMWKKAMYQLHPGDFAKRYPKVLNSMDKLYKDNLITFNSHVESLFAAKDPSVLSLLSERPGDFKRRLMQSVKLFGDKAVESFCKDEVCSKLTVNQLVNLKSYIRTINSRVNRTFPPKGNWTKMKVDTNNNSLTVSQLSMLFSAVEKQLKNRVPKVSMLDDRADLIKLPSNGEVGPYNRGTVFPIPDDVDFIRSASYWEVGHAQTIWFDNGWNFFNSNWAPMGACFWNDTKFGNGAAIFSGDPVSGGEMKGRAAQMIDVYLSKLKAKGVRYAVWNVLAYSNIPFSDVKEVYAALQWGSNAQTGKLFEPSRCQLSFPLTGKNKTKYVALIDVEKREMVYLDANLAGVVSSAAVNTTTLSQNLPKFMEYVKSLPSVYDLFESSVDPNGDIKVLYSDADVELKDEKAYVFKPENKQNKFTPVDINKLLA